MITNALRVACAYLLIAASVVLAVYFLTDGASPFGPDYIDPFSEGMQHFLARVSCVPELLVTFVARRSLTAALEGLVIAVCLRRAIPAAYLLVIGTALPLLLELIIAPPLVNEIRNAERFADQFGRPIAWTTLVTGELVFKIVVTQLAAPVLAGFGVSSWVVRRRRSGGVATSSACEVK